VRIFEAFRANAVIILDLTKHQPRSGLNPSGFSFAQKPALVKPQILLPMNSLFYVRYKSSMLGTLALYDTYPDIVSAERAITEQRKRFRAAGLDEEAKSIGLHSH
jgi:hypothetical protein